MSARLPLIWHFSTRKLYQPLQRGFDRLSTHLITVAIEPATVGDKRMTVTPAQPHRTDRLVDRTAARPSHTADRHSEARATFTLRTADHGFDDRLADCPDLREQRL